MALGGKEKGGEEEGGWRTSRGIRTELDRGGGGEGECKGNEREHYK